MPTIVMEGITVVPLIVAMHVPSHASCWLLQPLRQVAELDDELCAEGEVVLGVVGVPELGDAVVSGAAGAVVSCAPTGAVDPNARTAARTARLACLRARFIAPPHRQSRKTHISAAALYPPRGHAPARPV